MARKVQISQEQVNTPAQADFSVGNGMKDIGSGIKEAVNNAGSIWKDVNNAYNEGQIKKNDLLFKQQWNELSVKARSNPNHAEIDEESWALAESQKQYLEDFGGFDKNVKSSLGYSIESFKQQFASAQDSYRADAQAKALLVDFNDMQDMHIGTVNPDGSYGNLENAITNIDWLIENNGLHVDNREEAIREVSGKIQSLNYLKGMETAVNMDQLEEIGMLITEDSMLSTEQRQNLLVKTRKAKSDRVTLDAEYITEAFEKLESNDATYEDGLAIGDPIRREEWFAQFDANVRKEEAEFVGRPAKKYTVAQTQEQIDSDDPALEWKVSDERLLKYQKDNIRQFQLNGTIKVPVNIAKDGVKVKKWKVIEGKDAYQMLSRDARYFMKSSPAIYSILREGIDDGKTDPRNEKYFESGVGVNTMKSNYKDEHNSLSEKYNEIANGLAYEQTVGMLDEAHGLFEQLRTSGVGYHDATKEALSQIRESRARNVAQIALSKDISVGELNAYRKMYPNKTNDEIINAIRRSKGQIKDFDDTPPIGLKSITPPTQAEKDASAIKKAKKEASEEIAKPMRERMKRRTSGYLNDSPYGGMM